MEASKCPKCGEEPTFVEHIEKWYCYGCNSYLEDEHEHQAESEHLPHEATPSPVEEPAEEPPKHACKKCGAELEQVGDGKLYCFICESYPSDKSAEAKHEHKEVPKPEAKKNEAQAFLDSLASSVAAAVPVASAKALVEPKPSAPAEAHAAPESAGEGQLKSPGFETCHVCGQPLKYIEKYQRHYCYSCRKYAPKKGAAERAPGPLHTPPNRKMCPDCRSELRYIEKYREFYCYNCKSYPLRRSAKPSGTKKPVNPKTARLSCPKCGDQLRWIDRYQRHYCYSCKSYAPKGFGLDSKTCPLCKGAMRFVAEYNEWYCYKCKKYSLRPSKPILLV